MFYTEYRNWLPLLSWSMDLKTIHSFLWWSVTYLTNSSNDICPSRFWSPRVIICWKIHMQEKPLNLTVFNWQNFSCLCFSYKSSLSALLDSYWQKKNNIIQTLAITLTWYYSTSPTAIQTYSLLLFFCPFFSIIYLLQNCYFEVSFDWK